jgi:hypothetical protein
MKRSDDEGSKSHILRHPYAQEAINIEKLPNEETGTPLGIITSRRPMKYNKGTMGH